ncbi:WRKY transcription factor [Datura stramonium]|uniref:WRKY transcription factor n=1 Tax=Datura stramonium TaxID=4076 RepID=A0ABS8SJM7_DATST|nr:WRKY transcription factor [Datura stramonium]
MGGFDDYVAGFGDWIPPSPSPTALLSSLLVDDVGGWADQTVKLSAPSEQKMSSRGGLLGKEIAARAGFTAQRLDRWHQTSYSV